MIKIEMGSGLNVLEQGVVVLKGDIIPSDMGHTHGFILRQFIYDCINPPEPFMIPVLCRAMAKKL